ncbi:hypothetical protein HD554DRAFT_2035382 [Boletus coccyginus]|nr:hypothetical protein HD554DRAFT_2035382 [Boletus coccyginus]
MFSWIVTDQSASDVPELVGTIFVPSFGLTANQCGNIARNDNRDIVKQVDGSIGWLAGGSELGSPWQIEKTEKVVLPSLMQDNEKHIQLRLGSYHQMTVTDTYQELEAQGSITDAVTPQPVHQSFSVAAPIGVCHVEHPTATEARLAVMTARHRKTCELCAGGWPTSVTPGRQAVRLIFIEAGLNTEGRTIDIPRLPAQR